MTRPKEGTKRRVIVDLSYPYEYGRSVNSVTSAEIYLETAYSLKLPTVDTICDLINNVGGSVKLFKVDLARAFRQLKIDLADVFNLGLKVEGEYYLVASLPFRWRSGMLACQRVTDCVTYILNKQGVVIAKYIDDFIGICPADIANEHFKETVDLLHELNLQISGEKTVAPRSRVTCLGIEIDCNKGCLFIPENKLSDILQICKKYLKKSCFTCTELQSGIGLLIFMHKAVKSARMFINRIISLLRQMRKPHSSIVIDSDMRRDLNWFIKCASQCNGMVKIDKCFFMHIELFIDASKMGLGACWGSNVYQLSLGLRGHENIAVLEAINIVVHLEYGPLNLRIKRLEFGVTTRRRSLF
jgi:hypothetical protein